MCEKIRKNVMRIAPSYLELYRIIREREKKKHLVLVKIVLNSGIVLFLSGLNGCQFPFKGSIVLKSRHFIIQERFNKLIYGITPRPTVTPDNRS